MTVLAPNVPHETDLGFVDVGNRLEPGKYRFRQTVFDEAKNESAPAFIIVTVNEARPKPEGGFGGGGGGRGGGGYRGGGGGGGRGMDDGDFSGGRRKEPRW